jgi:hypothetical protein
MLLLLFISSLAVKNYNWTHQPITASHKRKQTNIKENKLTMLRHVALVRTDVSEELSASLIRVTRIGELGTTLAVTSNRYTLRRNTRFLQEPHSVTSQKTPFFGL